MLQTIWQGRMAATDLPCLLDFTCHPYGKKQSNACVDLTACALESTPFAWMHWTEGASGRGRAAFRRWRGWCGGVPPISAAGSGISPFGSTRRPTPRREHCGSLVQQERSHRAGARCGGLPSPDRLHRMRARSRFGSNTKRSAPSLVGLRLATLSAQQATSTIETACNCKSHRVCPAGSSL